MVTLRKFQGVETATFDKVMFLAADDYYSALEPYLIRKSDFVEFVIS